MGLSRAGMRSKSTLRQAEHCTMINNLIGSHESYCHDINLLNSGAGLAKFKGRALFRFWLPKMNLTSPNIKDII